MLPTMATKPAIAIVGPGRLGSSLALELSHAGYVVPEIVVREVAGKRKAASLARALRARISSRTDAFLTAGVIWFCVPDQAIAPAAQGLATRARWKGKVALHSSGALTSDELSALRKQGASVAAVHPLMTFAGGSTPSLKGVPFALEGDAAAVRVAGGIVRKLGGEPFTIRKRDKVAYHAWGMFASPLLVALLMATEQVAELAGISAAKARRRMLPILRQTITNYAALGPGEALTGPFVRGDVAVVRKHLRALRGSPKVRAVYAALAGAALRSLPGRRRRQLESALRK